MAKSLICPTCSAPFTGAPISAWTKSVKCNYCGGNLLIDEFEQMNEAFRQFDMQGFESFLRQKGVPFDPVSGAVTVGDATFFIDSSGLVIPDRPEALRQVVLRWIAEYVEL